MVESQMAHHVVEYILNICRLVEAGKIEVLSVLCFLIFVGSTVHAS